MVYQHKNKLLFELPEYDVNRFDDLLNATACPLVPGVELLTTTLFLKSTIGVVEA